MAGGNGGGAGGGKLALVWRPRAQLDRESIALYLGAQCRAPQAALAAMQAIDAAVERVRLFPESGSHVHIEGLAHSDYRAVLANPYTVYYRFNEHTLAVYRVLHQRQDIGTFTLVDF